jgi:hypothetical protein
MTSFRPGRLGKERESFCGVDYATCSQRCERLRHPRASARDWIFSPHVFRH